MQSGTIPDSSLSASTFKDNLHKAVNARPSQSVGWCSKVIFALDRFLLQVIIYMKTLLDSDWLRTVKFKCNTSAKSVTSVLKV